MRHAKENARQRSWERIGIVWLEACGQRTALVTGIREVRKRECEPIEFRAVDRKV